MLAVAVAAAAVACGPPHAHTLAANAQARVFIRAGHAYACDVARRHPRSLGDVIAVKLNGSRLAVRRHRGTGTERVSTYNLRSGRATGSDVVDGKVSALAIDHLGYAAYVATRPGSPPRAEVVGVATPTLDGDPTIDPGFVAAAEGTVAFRDAHGFRPLWIDAVHTPATLFSAGPLRASIGPGGLSLRRAGGPAIALGAASPADPDGSSQGSSGIDVIQIAGRFAGVHLLAWGPSSTDSALAVYDTVTGSASEPCNPHRPPGDPAHGDDHVDSFVVTRTGAVACLQQILHVPRVLSGGVVIDEGMGIDPDSLIRRGDQLVWRRDGQERTAPLPTASA